MWMQTTNTANCKEREKLVAILMDEMHIREDLVYDKHTGGILAAYLICLYVHVLQGPSLALQT